MQNLILTIIVPFYNVEKYLGQCMESLIALDCIGQYEVLMVDDCGQDSSLLVAERYIEKYPDIFKLIQHDANKGISAARNSGLAQTESPYVMFVDSDDWLSEGAIKPLLNTIANSSPDFLFFDFTREWQSRREDMPFLKDMDEPKPISNELYFSFLQKVPVTPWGKVLKTDTAKKFCFTEGIIFEDVAIIPLMILKSKSKLYYPGIRYHYRQREGSIMAERRGEIESLFNAYNILLSNLDEVNDNNIRQDLVFILLRDWLINVRVAYREKKYKKSMRLLDEGILFFNVNTRYWIKSDHLIRHLSSTSFWSKLKIKFILSLINKKPFKLFFLLHINYLSINWKNTKTLIGIQSVTSSGS